MSTVATQTPSKRASATKIIPPSVLPPPVSLDAIPVEHLAPAPNTHKPSDVTKPELHVDQAIVDAFLHAEGEAKQAAVALFRACVTRSVASVQFVGRADAKVRASEFNCAYAVGMQFGYDNARRIIDAASEQAGDKRANVLAALRKAKEFGAQLKKAALKGNAMKKALERAGADALEYAEDAQNFVKNSKARGAQLPRIPKSDSVEAFAPIALAALGDMLDTLGKLHLKPRQLERVKTLKDALEDAVDCLKGLVPVKD